MIRRSALCWLALLPLLCLNLFPFLVMLSIVLAPAPGETDDGPWAVLSRGARAVSAMMQASGFATAFVNSLQVALAASFCSVLVAVPAAYAMSRHRFRLRRPLGDLLLMSQMMSPLVLVLGLSQTIAWLRLGNSLAALVLIYAAFQVAFAVWLLHGYFDAIPREIEEAARVDGASPLRTLWSIFLPLSLPAIVVTGLVGFIAAWNEFALALTILRSQRNYTLSVQVYALVAGRYEVQWRDVMAAIFAASVPVAVLFGLLHRSLLRGLHSGLGR